MSSDRWSVKRVKDIARINYGKELSDNVSGNIPVYGSGGVFRYTHTPNTSSPVLVIANKGYIGSLRYFNSPVYCVRSSFFVDSKSTDVNIRWLYYYFHTLDLSIKTIGVGLPFLSRKSIYSKNILVPPLLKQKAITEFLDAKLSSINFYIKSKKITLYNLMCFKDSCYCYINNFYKNTRLKYISSLISGKSLSNKPVLNNPQQINVVTFKSITNDNIIKSYLQSGKVTYNFLNKNKLCFNDVLMTNKGDCSIFGKSVVFSINSNNYIAGDGVHVIRVNQDLVDPEFLSMYIRTATCKKYFCSHNLQACYPPRITTSDLKNLPVPLIPLPDQKQIATTVKSKISKINSCINLVQSQIKLMEEYCKSLIFEAVTGKLDI